MTITAGPYEAKIPRTDAPAGGYPTAEQELATALEGQAPTLARELAGILGPVRTVKLAQAIGRAVAVGINRRAEAELADRMHGLYAVLEDGLQLVDPECDAPDPELYPVDPALCVCGKPIEHTLADPDSAEWACRVPEADRG